MKRMVVTLTALTLWATGCKPAKKPADDQGVTKAETSASPNAPGPSAADSQNAAVPGEVASQNAAVPAEVASQNADILSDSPLDSQTQETVFMPEPEKAPEADAEISAVLALEDANSHIPATGAETAPEIKDVPLTSENPDFVRSCNVEGDAGVVCLQNADGSSLFFCNGTESKSECDTARFAQTCSKTIPAGEPTGQAQILTYFLPKAMQGFEECGGGTLKQL